MEITEVDLKEKINTLQLSLPGDMAFLPENIETVTDQNDFIFPETLIQLKKVFRANGIAITPFGSNSPKLMARKTADIFLPSLFIGLGIASENPIVVSITLNVLSNYLTDFFKGTFEKKTVSLDIYVEKNGQKKITKIEYKGSIEGLKSLSDVIKQLK